MPTYALIKDGVVDNLVVWDGETAVAFDGDPVPAGPGADIGATWDGEVFTAPVEEPPPPSDLQLLVEKLVEKKVITKEDAGTIGVAVAVDVSSEVIEP